jgi:hypothetical protein
MSKTTITATLIGSNRAIALGIEAHGFSPVLALCRALIEAGYDPTTPLHVYRGDTLALKVRSIGEGAKLAVEDNSVGTPVFRRRRDRVASSGAATPVAPTAPDRHPVPPLRSPPTTAKIAGADRLPHCGCKKRRAA